jgi:phage shock protein C
MYCSSCGVEMAENFRFCPQCGVTQKGPGAPAAYPALRRMREDKKIAGVCSGLARYMGLDVTLVRILVICLAVWGIGVVFYIACWIVMPIDPLLLPPPGQTQNAPMPT